ncbi:MAG: AbrB/MazE/SpoVT family DNA-binding domain-containing protein [Candidatus Parabeggiatoa sp.]|nr:AbrB/MazE/SpoVT family DNA-binding domain-containing protein [Candidatus Parabeggiatoa sp.]
MLENTGQIDLQGRITLPKDALEVIGLLPNMKVIIEWTKNSIVIKPKPSLPPITYCRNCKNGFTYC